jgi:hypothetical protein
MSSRLTNAELNQMRADLEDVVLPDTCNLLTATNTADGVGGYTIAWGTVTTNVPCRIDPIVGRYGQQAWEKVVGGAVQPFERYMLYLPHDTTVTSHYRVEQGDNTYNIIGISLGASWPLYLQALVEKV